MKVDCEKTRCKLSVENPAVKLLGSPNTVRNHVQKWVGQSNGCPKDETYGKKIETKIYGEVDEKKVRSNMRVH
jgi:hypothetical protein